MFEAATRFSEGDVGRMATNSGGGDEQARIVLTPVQLDKVLEPLVKAYQDNKSLVNAVWFKTGIALDEDFDLGTGKRPFMRDVLRHANANGWIETLLRAAAAGEQRSVPLRQAVAALLSPLPEPPQVLPPVGPADDPTLQDVVRRRHPLMSMTNFIAWTGAISRAVCWIGYEDARQENPQIGSGFLVGPDLLLTNFHVIRPILEAEMEPGAVICRFDHLSKETAPGLSAKLAAEWCLDKSPPAPADLYADGREPTVDELDYALIRLDRDIGGASCASGQPRGWLQLAEAPAPLLQNDVLFVVQHPARVSDSEEGAQRVSLGIVLGFDRQALRVHYDANTTEGSSGSPVLTANFDLAALHHGTEPLQDRQGRRVAHERRYNRAIPLRPIVKRMAAQGVPKFWT